MNYFSSYFSPNPEPAYEGQCIRGYSGIALVAARIYRKGRRSTLGWRAAHVKCGWALDGGLQKLLAVLKDLKPGSEKVIHVHPQIYRNNDIMGAMETMLPDYDFVNSEFEPPREGNIEVKAVDGGEELVSIYGLTPTKTETGVKQDSTPPPAKTLPTSDPKEVANADKGESALLVAADMDAMLPPPPPSIAGGSSSLFGGRRPRRTRKSRKSRKSRRRSSRRSRKH